MVPGLATNKFTKHQILIILWNNHHYLNFNGGQQLSARGDSKK